jgi:hypothetical protein
MIKTKSDFSPVIFFHRHQNITNINSQEIQIITQGIQILTSSPSAALRGTETVLLAAVIGEL